MDNLVFSINNYYDLLNLHKALLEAKFHKNPDNENVAGSPIIAKMCNDIVDLLTQYDIERKGKNIWTDWRKIENQIFYKKRVIEAIMCFEKWNKLSYENKISTIQNYLSPFICTQKDFDELINELDNINS